MVTTSVRRAGRGKKEVLAELLKTDHARRASGNGISASNQEFLRRLYAFMLRLRMLSKRTQNLVSGCRMVADRDLAKGHEAIVAGATLELEPEDTMISSFSDLATPIATGGRLSTAAHRNGDQIGIATACADSMGSLDSFNLGTGLALAFRLEKKRNVVVALSSEHTAPPDRWHEAMKFAGTHKLPIIYVLGCKSVFKTRKVRKTPALAGISFMARGCGFPAVIVDASDAVALWRVTQESIHRARSGAGPTLIECETSLTQYEDPLAHLEHYMRKRGMWDDQWRRERGKGWH
jgi:acetoin:2,6-dichlorophenolindophenol oxidoreductase subunit alpha